jgi:hypothetical protein
MGRRPSAPCGLLTKHYGMKQCPKVMHTVTLDTNREPGSGDCLDKRAPAVVLGLGAGISGNPKTAAGPGHCRATAVLDYYFA